MAEKEGFEVDIAHKAMKISVIGCSLIRYNKLRKFQNRRNENSPQNKGQGQRHLVE